ncbi:mate-domain-containing protein [Pilobolus umbonatus]|nr:mate-domain-containing protein [Pilobolus umbonatus]
MFVNVSAWSIAYGTTTALDTLCSQAWTGARDKTILGTHLQRAYLILAVMFIPIATIWWHAESLLLSLNQDPELARFAGLFLRYLIPGAPAYIAFEATKRYLQAQGIMHASTYSMLITAPINFVLNYMLVYTFNMGFIGAPIATSFSYWLMFMLLLLYIKCVKGSEGWGGWTAECLTGWWPFMKLAFSGIVIVCAEWTAFEISSLAASYLGTTELAAQSILLTISSATYTIPLGYLFSSDEDIISLVARILPLCSIFQVADGVASVGGGIIRGSGRQSVAAMINLVAYYVIALPIGFYLTFYAKWALIGLWTGLSIALFLVATGEVFFLWNIDWRDQIPLPDKEIQTILNTHNTLTLTELLNGFQSILNQISKSVEFVHLSVFTLEQNIKNDNYELNDMVPLETATRRLEPIIKILSDLEDIVYNKGDDNYTKIKITKIQSEWSSLQHFLASVQKQFMLNKESKELAELMDSLLLQIDDVSTLIFSFQERKHMTLVALPTSSSSDSERTGSESTVTNSTDIFTDYAMINVTESKWFQNKDDQAIADIDHSFEQLLQSIEVVYTRVATNINHNKLNKKLEKLKDRWETLQNEHDDLKFEHKEDRWLTVFRRVADQVDVMIDGLDRSVVQCYSVIQQTRDWHSITKSPPPVDKEKFRSIEKSFEAKYKYYTPSIDRMLSMLGNGIASRASRDNAISQRHDSMIQRWTHLKEVMDELRSRDLQQQRNPPTNSIMQNNNPIMHTNNINHNNMTNRQINKVSRPTRNMSPMSPISSPIKKDIDFYEEDERDYGIDLMKVVRPPSSLRNVPADRRRNTEDGRGRAARAKTPNDTRKNTNNGGRSKSSMGEIRTDRVMSPPHHRSVTPSLIPRPKTSMMPTTPMIPRPKSSLRNSKVGTNAMAKPGSTPPIPDIPRNIENDMGRFRDSPVKRKQSMPMMRQEISIKENYVYQPNPKDLLDVEVGRILNACPITIKCQKAQPGRYYFGDELSVSSMAGKKLYTCKLMTYGDRRGGQYKNNKVLIRVGGGWQDLEFFLLEHSSLMASEVVVRSFGPESVRSNSRRS